jgi:flagellar basal-body rod protein FlgB
MIDKIFTGDLMSLLQRSLDAGALQHRVLSNNLANVDTPGFKRSEVVFQERLKAALDSRENASGNLEAFLTNPKHISFDDSVMASEVKPSVVTENRTSLRNDGNNVDIDVEMAKLSENAVFYNATAQIVSQRYAQILAAIREGK